ncbi:PAS domain S-box protein [Bacillus sp. FJAT-49682]|uniref:histidine kinase n=1 Tax=Lederbergia citrea TaxID=2833581 RepID=A0A942UH88_9BACI|nr:PAS domain S-box protein [Lederbergia citrea]
MKLMEREKDCIFASKNSEVIIRRSLKGVFLDVSPSVKTAFGYDPENLIGKSCFDYIHSDDVGDFLSPLAKGEIEIATFTYRVKHSGGHYIWIETTAVAVKNPHSNIPIEILSIGRDITDRKKTYDQVIEAENLSAIGQLAAGIAHDIRNPLTTVKGFLQLMGSQKEFNNEYLILMQNEIERIEQITKELMFIGKPSVNNYEQLDIIKILKEVTMLLKPEAISNNVSFEYSGMHIPVFIVCEEIKVKQVFMNIIKNGIEAMGCKGGTLTLDVTINNQENRVVIAISDEGCGISQDDLEKIGEPFFTTKAKGNGLGLMMCNKIIQEHNGSIDVTSELNQGTTFKIALPKSAKSGMIAI